MWISGVQKIQGKGVIVIASPRQEKRCVSCCDRLDWAACVLPAGRLDARGYDIHVAQRLSAPHSELLDRVLTNGLYVPPAALPGDVV